MTKKKETVTPAVITPAVAPQVVAKKATIGKKRGQYKQKECPFCHVFVGNLGNHVNMKHPGETPPLEITKDELLGVKGTTPLPKKATELTPPTYFCTDCKAELRKGEEKCWNCGAVMNWEGI